MKNVHNQKDIVDWFHNSLMSMKTSVQYETILIDVEDEEDDMDESKLRIIFIIC